MSGAGQNASEIETRAARWLASRDRDDWNGTDQQALDAWLNEDIRNSVAYWRLEAAWSDTDRLKVLRRPGRSEETVIEKRRIWLLLLSVAAALATVAVVGFGARFLFQPAIRTYATAIGERETIRFTDGSQIELNTDTKLRAEVGAGGRKVWLDKGEAYFQIHHDASNPFVVIAGDRYITDLGTKFRIRRDPGRLEVALVEGRAQLETSDSRAPEKPMVLVPGDTAVATATSVSLVKTPSKGIARELAWRHGKIVFNNTTLADAAAEFNRYNRERIIVADPRAATTAIYGTFQTNNVAAFARLAHEVLGLTIERRNGDIIITR
jgi:transmembrane sensor